MQENPSSDMKETRSIRLRGKNFGIGALAHSEMNLQGVAGTISTCGQTLPLKVGHSKSLKVGHSRSSHFLFALFVSAHLCFCLSFFPSLSCVFLCILSLSLSPCLSLSLSVSLSLSLPSYLSVSIFLETFLFVFSCMSLCFTKFTCELLENVRNA